MSLSVQVDEKQSFGSCSFYYSLKILGLCYSMHANLVNSVITFHSETKYRHRYRY